MTRELLMSCAGNDASPAKGISLLSKAMENDHMSDLERQAHWENVYRTKGERDVSWFQESPAISLDLIHAAGV